MSTKICMFGVSGSGKTCYLHAMSQVFNNGVEKDGTSISVIANNMEQQDTLNRGYLRMIRGLWPPPSRETTEYDFAIRVQTDGLGKDIIPSLIFLDYRGGIWEHFDEEDNDDKEKRKKEYEELLHRLCDDKEKNEYTTSVLFMIDANTLLNAMDMMDKDPKHKIPIAIDEQVEAQQQISFIENLFKTFKRCQKNIPPILVVITKSDIFASDFEIEKGKQYVRRKLPSLFAKGSNVWAGITNVALGNDLTNVNNKLGGTLDITMNHNIHIPIIFSLYAYLSESGGDEDDMRTINALLPKLRNMFAQKVELYYNGNIAIAVD